METAAPTTEGLDRIVERFQDLPARDWPYPDGAVFIAADLPNFGRVMSRALLEGDPIVVIYPDGRERLVRPRSPRGASVMALIRATLERARRPLGR